MAKALILCATRAGETRQIGELIAEGLRIAGVDAEPRSKPRPDATYARHPAHSGCGGVENLGARHRTAIGYGATAPNTEPSQCWINQTPANS